MPTSRHRLALLSASLLVYGASLCKAQVIIDLASARAVLQSVQNTGLTAPQAEAVCNLPGNQGLVRKENSYGRRATTQSCADALLAAARGQSPDAAFQFNFGSIKPRAAELAALLDRIESSPVEFQQWVTSRVNEFSPPNSRVAISGYLIAGGPSGGFAFGEPEFYLNLAVFPDFDVARVVMAHELYHAVQGAYEPTQRAWWGEKDAQSGPYHVLARQCSTTYDYFDALYQEGTASYVGDPLLLRDVKSPPAQQMVTDMQDGIAHVSRSVTLLEQSITDLNDPNPVPYEQVYARGFYVPEIEYKLGYMMAKAIASDRGKQAIAGLLIEPRYAFTDAYLSLPKYGKDDAHPMLGQNAVAAIRRLWMGCPRSDSTRIAPK